MRQLGVDSLRGLTPGAAVPLDARTQHHLLRVLRVDPGTPVRLADAAGWQAVALLEEADGGLLARLTASAAVAPVLPHLELAVVAPRPERAAWLVEKATELGVAAITWLLTERAQPHSRHPRADRLARVAAAAAEQAGVARPPRLSGPVPLGDFLAGSGRAAGRWWVATPGAPSAWLGRARACGPADDASARSWGAIVGPEGGLTRDEQAAAEAAGAVPVGLGPTVLRVETAAVATAVVGRTLLAADERGAP